MAFFPDMPFLQPRTGEFSSVDNLKCVGPFYADQIQSVCKSRLIGPVLQFFSHREFDSVKQDLILCCKNKRAGEVLTGDKKIPLYNSRVMMTLLQLLAFGRKHPDHFLKYPVDIKVPSATLNAFLIEIQTQM